jgi:hypothetical protein
VHPVEVRRRERKGNRLNGLLAYKVASIMIIVHRSIAFFLHVAERSDRSCHSKTRSLAVADYALLRSQNK